MSITSVENEIGKRKFNRLIKLLILVTMYHDDPDWPHPDVKSGVKNEIINLADRWNFPSDIFNKIKTNDEAINFIMTDLL